MSTPAPTTPPNPDPRAVYQAAYDALGNAYWDAPDEASKSTISKAQQAVGDILTAINLQQLATNTDLIKKLGPQVKAANDALAKVQADIAKITKNVATASTVISAISKVVSMTAGLVTGEA